MDETMPMVDDPDQRCQATPFVGRSERGRCAAVVRSPHVRRTTLGIGRPPPAIGPVRPARRVFTVDEGPTSQAGADRFAEQVVPEIGVMLRVARSITGNGAEAEDLVQDALIRAYRGIDGFDGRHPRAWLLTIVRNTHINRHRRRRPSLLDDPDEREVESLLDPSPSGEDTYLAATFDARVEASMAALGNHSRQVIELVDLAGLSYAEAADVLGIPIGTVMSRLHRARRRIRDDLHERGYRREQR